MIAAHAMLGSLSVSHAWVDGPQRAHHWDSGWLAEAIEFLHLAAPAQVFQPMSDAGPDSAVPDAGADSGALDATADDASTGDHEAQDSSLSEVGGDVLGEAAPSPAADDAGGRGTPARASDSCGCRTLGLPREPGAIRFGILLLGACVALCRSRRRLPRATG